METPGKDSPTLANAATRVEILKSAAMAFRKLGYHGATVEQIAATLEMKKGNLYYYFKNKEDILFACHQHSVGRLLEILAEIERSDARPAEKLRQLVFRFVHTILDELHGVALFVDLEALAPEHRKELVEQRDEFDRGLRRVVQAGVESGDFGPVDPKLMSFAILGSVNWIPRWYSPNGPRTSQEIAEHFADFFIRGLRPL